MRPAPARRLALLAVGAVAAVTSGCGLLGDDGDDGPAPTAAPSPTSTAPAGTSVPPSTEAPVDDRGPDRPADHATLSAWGPCRPGFECATLTVPLDWAEVDGEAIDLAVMRRPASGEPLGSLVLNPGGPGVSGIEFLASFGALPDGLDARFDVVTWDPRGTGESARIDCTSDEELLEPEIDPTVEDEADVAAIRADAAEAVAACERAAGDRLALVGTRATVRDLDALRGALGDDALTYLGYSYGTTIGLEYLRLYPDRVRAMVLDGVSVPGVEPVEDTYVQAQGFERTLDAYLADCPARDGCPLGDDPAATLAGLVERLEDERLPASYTLATDDAEQRDGTLGVGELYIAIASALYSRTSWDVLDQGLAEALDDRPSGQTLLALRDSYLGRQPDGSWADDGDARAVIRCADQEERVDQPEGDLELADEWGAELPFWGRWFASGTPGCWGLPEAVEPLGPLAPVTEAPPVVLVGSTDDPATPYSQSEDAAELVEGSVLVTYVGAEHTAYRSLSDCIDEPVTAYLVDLTPPPAGLRCEG